jgi:hypothetical protein
VDLSFDVKMNTYTRFLLIFQIIFFRLCKEIGSVDRSSFRRILYRQLLVNSYGHVDLLLMNSLYSSKLGLINAFKETKSLLVVGLHI